MSVFSTSDYRNLELSRRAYGCLQCPPGHKITAGKAFAALERSTQRVLKLANRDLNFPDFAITRLPIIAGSDEQGDRIFTKYGAGWADIHNLDFQPTEPSEGIVVEKLNAMSNCGPQALESTMFTMDSIGCAPGIGPGPMIGKDVTGKFGRTANLSIGPYCLSSFENFEDFHDVLMAVSDAAPKWAILAYQYQRIRDFILNCRMLAAPREGEVEPNFGAHYFPNEPTAQPSVDWLMEFAAQVAVNWPMGETVVLDGSAQFLRNVVKTYAESQGIGFEAVWGTERRSLGTYLTQWTDNGVLEFKDLRCNRRVQLRADDSVQPTYVHLNEVGPNRCEWEFQPWFIPRRGTDYRDNQGAGWMPRPNSQYGKAEVYCEDLGTRRRTYEMVIAASPSDSIRYRAFDRNPFKEAAGYFNSDGLETDQNNLWNSPEIDWIFEGDVDQYWLEPMRRQSAENARLWAEENGGQPPETFCGNNRKKTWFAGDLSIGGVTEILDAFNFGAFLAPVPDDRATNVRSEPKRNSVMCEGKEILPKEPGGEMNVCKEQEFTGPEPGCIQVTPCGVQKITLLPNGVIEFPINLRRKGGSSGELSVDLTFTDGTAVAGNDYVASNQTVIFEDGETWKQVGVQLPPRKGGETRNFKVSFSGDLCDGGCECITFCLTGCQPVAPDECDLCDEEPGEVPDGCWSVIFEDCVFDAQGQTVSLRDASGAEVFDLIEGQDYTAGDYESVKAALAAYLDDGVLSVDDNSIVFGDSEPAMGGTAIASLEVTPMGVTAQVIVTT